LVFWGLGRIRKSKSPKKAKPKKINVSMAMALGLMSKITISRNGVQIIEAYVIPLNGAEKCPP
jgi:peroxiredoxin family protein